MSGCQQDLSEDNFQGSASVSTAIYNSVHSQKVDTSARARGRQDADKLKGEIELTPKLTSPFFNAMISTLLMFAILMIWLIGSVLYG